MASPSRKGRKALLGKKIGMTQVFEESGRWIPVTVLQAGPCTVLQVKSEDTDGYEAVQLGFADKRKAKKPQQALVDKIGTAPKRFIREVPHVDPADILSSTAGGTGDSEDGDGGGEGGAVAPGAVLGAKVFDGIEKVDVRGLTKGRGFTGTIKRHGFSAGDHSLGSKSVREPCSTGMHTDRGRVP